MTLHLIKLAVGAESVKHLKERQALRYKSYNTNYGKSNFRILTRNMPRRGEEIINKGGSIFWLVKGQILVRQKIVSIELLKKTVNERKCAIYLDASFIPVYPKRFRPFQGWRYFEGVAVPTDLPSTKTLNNEPSPKMVAELSDLGLI